MKKMYTIIFSLVLLASCRKEEQITFENIDLTGEWSVAKLKTTWDDQRQLDDRIFTMNYVRGGAEDIRVDATIKFDQMSGIISGNKMRFLGPIDFEWEKSEGKLIWDYSYENYNPGPDDEFISLTTDTLTVDIIDNRNVILKWVPRGSLYNSYKIELERKE